jgi:hypothetical protein|tara:strand:- start:34 stop:393 length:360 start_codon:yes stop_codon:yes gene_type:complete
MPKIPILKSNFRTLTQVFPVVQRSSDGQPGMDSDGNILNQAMNITTDLYVDVNLFCGVSKYFDPVSGNLRSNYTQVHVVGLSVNAFPVVLKESVSDIKAWMNQRNNCLELCDDGCNCPT